MAVNDGLAAGREADVAPVVVTATRSAARISSVVAEVTVIDAQRIAASAGQSLMSLLAEEPGLQFASNGGLGKSGSVYIRGGESRHALVLIDGVRYGSATLGTPSLENIPLGLIDRIEIVRGPLSSLYGSEAAAGVIQIFTKKGRQGALAPFASVTLGTDSLLQAAAGASGGDGPVNFNVGLQYQFSEGGSATNPREPWGNFHPDRDGFSQRSASVNGGVKLSSDWRADVSFLGAEGVSHFDDGESITDPGVQASARLKTRLTSVALKGSVWQDWQMGWKASSSEDVNDTYEAANSWTLGRFRTRQDQLAWENHVPSAWGEWLWVLERVRQFVRADQFGYERTDRTLTGMVLGLSGEAGPHTWQASVRRDENSQFGGENTGALAYGHALPGGWRAGASIGSSFVAPSFNQLYYPGYGNPGLLPERGLQRELSLTWAQGKQAFRWSAYENRIRSFIVAGPGGGNVPHARLTGITLSASAAVSAPVGELDLGGSYDWTHARNEATGRALPLRAEHAFSTRLAWKVGAWTHTLRWKGRAGAYSDVANTESGRVAGFSILSIGTQWALSRQWQWSLRVENVADRQVETQLGYNQPGRQVMTTLAYSANAF